MFRQIGLYCQSAKVSTSFSIFMTVVDGNTHAGYDVAIGSQCFNVNGR